MGDSHVSHSLIVTHQSLAEVRRDNGCCLFFLAFRSWVILQRSFYLFEKRKPFLSISDSWRERRGGNLPF